MTEREALKLALDVLEEINNLSIGENAISLPAEIDTAMDAIKEALAQPEQEPVAFPRQVGDSTWTVDTAFIWRVKHTIDPDTPHDFTPSEEQIETVLLALEKIPSSLYATPPQRKPLTDGQIREVRKAFVEYIKNGQDEYAAFDFAFDDYKAAHGIKGDA